MTRLAVALACGYLALLALVVGLHRIFQSEARDARDELVARQRALAQYAVADLSQRFEQQLLEVNRRLEQVREDPLADGSGLYLSVDGERLVPPLPPGGVRESNAASELPFLLEGNAKALADDAGDSPRGERYRLVGAVVDAVNAKDRPRIISSVRAYLAHRAAFVLPTDTEVAGALAVALSLHRGATPDRTLLEGLLRKGFPGTTPLPGVMPQILSRRSRLSAHELTTLCALVLDASTELEVRNDDFAARCDEKEPPADSLPPPELDAGRWLSRRGGATWLLQSERREVRGVRLALDAMLASMTAEMQRLGLLGPDDAVHDVADESSLIAAGALALRVDSPQWQQVEARIAQRLQLKTALLAVVALSGLAIALLALTAQRRKLRFVELKSDFVSAVSHELKTPLASVRLMAETLEKKLTGVDAAKDYPTRIVRDIDGLSALVENILSFNRLDKGRWVAHRQSMSLASLEPVLREDAESAAVPVELSCWGFEGITLDADAELMRLLFLNLLRNAIRYNARTPVVVTMTAAREGGRVVVRVSDNGVGIPPAERERVFDEFFRLSGPSSRGGSGLGLALCRRIMTLHGGTIGIEQSSEAGTTFILSVGASAP